MTQNMFTNIGAAKAINLALHANCLLKRTSNINMKKYETSAEKAKCLPVPFNSSENRHLECEASSEFDESDLLTIMIGYPLMWQMNESVRRNDMYFNEKILIQRDRAPEHFA